MRKWFIHFDGKEILMSRDGYKYVANRPKSGRYVRIRPILDSGYGQEQQLSQSGGFWGGMLIWPDVDGEKAARWLGSVLAHNGQFCKNAETFDRNLKRSA